MLDHLLLIVVAHALAVVVASDRLDFTDYASSCRSAGFVFLEDSEAFLFELVEVFELTLALTDDEELLSFILDREWVLAVLLQVNVPVFRETQGWEHARGIGARLVEPAFGPGVHL